VLFVVASFSKLIFEHVQIEFFDVGKYTNGVGSIIYLLHPSLSKRYGNWKSIVVSGNDFDKVLITDLYRTFSILIDFLQPQLNFNLSSSKPKFLFVQFVNSCNVNHVLKIIFSNKLDLFWITCLLH
jgi:hypothetical protein